MRVSVKGIYVDGDATSREAAVAACKGKNGATVVVEDGVAPNVWPALRRELEDAHVKIYMRGLMDDRVCSGNPLARGCQ